MTQPIKRFVDVEITKDTPSVSAADFSSLLVLTTSSSLSTSTRVQEFTTVDAVKAVFGDSSEEADAADAYFNQDPVLTEQPESLFFGRYETGVETVAEAVQAILEKDDSWAAMGVVYALRDSSDTEKIADAVESLNKIFVVATNDASVLTQGDTSTFSYYVKNLNYKRTATIYCEDTDAYPDMSWMGQQLPKELGSTNWSFKTLAGIPEGAKLTITPSVLTEAQINAAHDVNCNVYTTTLGADFVHLGTMGGGRNADKDGEYIDIVRNVDFLQARVQEQLMSLLLEKDIIPMTNGGISLVDNRLKSVLQTYGVDQGILVQDSVVTSFPKRSEISQVNRDDRLLPDGTFSAELSGGINKVVVRGKVYI